MAVIEVNHVTKEYRLGQMRSIKQSMLNTYSKLRGKPVPDPEPFKALDDVNFHIEQGEVVGIIGQNGAGKSTLLKMLAKISVPTTGDVKVQGKVAPLIEVGAGLIPDLTGRENIYLNGTILGMKRSVLEKKFDEIVAFAELEEFIDTPIKRYSSGMKVRLGFSIATSIDAEILIVDEVLAVGDLAFQRRCFERMEALIKEKGKTVLVVSHNIRQIERLCTRAMLLDKGKVVCDGKPFEVSELYYKNSNKLIQDYQNKVNSTNVQSSGEVEVLEIDILDEQNNKVGEIESGGALRVVVKFKFNTQISQPEIVIGTHRTDFVYLTAGSTAKYNDRPDMNVGEHVVEYMIPSFPLVSGVYCIRVAVFDKKRRVVFAGETLKTFNVAHIFGEVKEPPNRSLNIPAQWKFNGFDLVSDEKYLGEGVL